MLGEIFALLIVYQLKHFVADFPLQGTYMLQKFKPDWGFFFPLLAHVTVHGGMTLAIVWFINPSLWWLALVDAGIHFTMDRLKAGPKYMGRWKPLTGEQYMEHKKKADEYDAIVPYGKLEAHDKLRGNVLFWWSLGIDQMIHHLTHYVIIYILVTS